MVHAAVRPDSVHTDTAVGPAGPAMRTPARPRGAWRSGQPAAPRRVGSGREVAAPPPPPTPAAAPGRARRVLVVARDAAVRRLLADVMADEGYEAVTAGDEVVGLRLAAERAPDLVLLDVGAAGSAGRRFVDGCRRQPEPRAPLVLLSAGGAAELVDAAEAAGASGFVRLPCELDDLLAVVGRLARPAHGPAGHAEAVLADLFAAP